MFAGIIRFFQIYAASPGHIKVEVKHQTAQITLYTGIRYIISSKRLWYIYIYVRLRYLIPVVISRSGFEGQNPIILKRSNFPANSGKVRYPNEKVPSAYITRQPERESAILVDPPRAKALGIN